MQEARSTAGKEEAALPALSPPLPWLRRRGSCGVRQVRDGKLVTMNYGLVAAAHWDPVEKKPLYHFYPGKEILSLGTYGCNLHCRFCQNWSLARESPTAGSPPEPGTGPGDSPRREGRRWPWGSPIPTMNPPSGLICIRHRPPAAPPRL